MTTIKNVQTTLKPKFYVLLKKWNEWNVASW